MDNTILQAILDYIWVPVVTALTLLWSKLTGLDTRASLLEQSEIHYQKQRLEDQRLRDEQRREILEKIESHHNMVMSKLDQVDTSVKNGH